jgi:hypothetical protein
MRRKIIILFVLVWGGAGPPFLFAQDASITTGGNAYGSGGMVSYSLGQLVYQTITSTSESITEGVQQPYEISVLTGIKESEIFLHISAYPNPVSNYCILSMPADFKEIIFR